LLCIAISIGLAAPAWVRTGEVSRAAHGAGPAILRVAGAADGETHPRCRCRSVTRRLRRSPLCVAVSTLRPRLEVANVIGRKGLLVG